MKMRWFMISLLLVFVGSILGNFRVVSHCAETGRFMLGDRVVTCTVTTRHG